MGCFSGSKSEQQQSNQSYLPEQENWLVKALKTYGAQLGQNNNVWQGDRVAGFTDTQKNVMDNAGSFMGTFGTPQKVGTPMFNETGSAIKDLLAGNTGAKKMTDNQRDDYFQKSTYDPTMRMLKDDLLPTIDEGYAGGNFFGSAKGKARDNMIGDVGNMLTDQKAGLDWNVLQNNQSIDEAAANRTLNTLAPAMNYGQMPAQETMNNLRIAASQVAGMGQLFGLGQAEQTQEQMQLEAQIAKFAEDNQITDPENLTILMSLLNMNYSSGQSSGFSSGPGLGYSMANSAVGRMNFSPGAKT